MPINVKKEGAAIRGLLDRADQLEAEADEKTAEADDCRWMAAERAHEVVAVQKAATQKAFAATTGLSTQDVSRMVRTWGWWLENAKEENPRDTDGRPTFYNAHALATDPSLRQRALTQGKTPSTVASDERRARAILKSPGSAEIVMADPTVRETARRAIVAAEATEAKSKLLARANPVDLPLPAAGFNWLDADATLSHARKLINNVARMVKDHGPLSDRDRDMVADSTREVRISLEILEAVVNTGDLDEALARLLEEA